MLSTKSMQLMNLNKVKNNFDRLFDKNLTDLVRGIRNNKNNEAKFIARCIEEIKEELKIPNVEAKANAVAKLTYLQMLGYDISWAAFNIIEVMSSERFTHKRIGYLAASQCFSTNTEVLMLTINMIRRDLCARNIYETGCALTGLSCFVSNEIGRELFNDVHRLLSSTKPYLRKKAVLVMYKILTVFPDTLIEVIPKLEDKLDDPDQGVQSSVINVVCELARKNPKDFLHLEGTLYKLMENSSNNWMLIKIIKLFGSLAPLEPRIGEKIIQPLENLAHSTSAMSVLYETISTIMIILASPSSKIPKSRASAYRQLCVQKLRIFIEDTDQNLKYLGLLAMKKMLIIHPKSVRAHQDIILSCLDDKDESIRLRALDLLYGMVVKANLTTPEGDGIVDRLMKHVSYPKMGNKFRDEIVFKVIDICSQNDYCYITNFDWYITVLVTLASIEGGTSHGNLIAQQLLDVVVRVANVRPYAVRQMEAILKHTDKFTTNFSVTEVLYAAAWICGEYSEFLADENETMFNLLGAKNFAPYILAIFVHNACKIFSRISLNHPDQLETLCERLIDKELHDLQQIDDLEVQERVKNFVNIVNLVKTNSNIDFTAMFYAYSLNPVNAQAQSKVQIPPELDLDETLEYDPESPLSSDESDGERDTSADDTCKPLSISPDFEDPRPLNQPGECLSLNSKRSTNRDNDIHYLTGDHTPYNPPPSEADLANSSHMYDAAMDFNEGSVLYAEKPLDNFQDRGTVKLEEAVEAIRISEPVHEARNFKGIPGLTSYSDFLKTSSPAKKKGHKSKKRDRQNK
jgi:AP-3 complex subunit delta-1